MQAEEQKRRAEADKLAALTALEKRSKEFLKEKEEKRALEMKIRAMQVCVCGICVCACFCVSVCVSVCNRMCACLATPVHQLLALGGPQTTQ